MTPAIEPLGDSALLVRLGEGVDAAAMARTRRLAQQLRQAAPAGVREVVAAFTTVTVHYQPAQVAGDAHDLRPAFERLRDTLQRQLAHGEAVQLPPGREVVVPVWYGGAAGPDLPDVAAACGLSEAEVVRRHQASPHEVALLGFAPGFPYITGLDPALHLPRRATPRTQVPAGSVAIARDQSCIYPQASPGGWHLLGRTPLPLFDPNASPPCWLQAGDRLRFEAIDEPHYRHLRARSARPPGSPSPEADGRPAGLGVPGGASPRACITVLHPGLQTQLQDEGRWGWQHLGVPVGGALDGWSHRLANRLVGNARDEATLEIVLAGPTLRFEQATRIALTGADLGPSIDGQPVPTGGALDLPPGAILRFRGREAGLRTYLAVAGGFDLAPVLGSRSTYVRGGFGGWAGRSLRAGDVLPLGRPTAGVGVTGSAAATGPDLQAMLPDPAPEACARVAVVTGAHWDTLSAAAQASFLAQAWRIGAPSDRMGYRLEGKALTGQPVRALLSEGVSMGTIQLPPDGQPIILMAERQSTGGYPRIAHVASVDLPLLAQLQPGQHMHFEPVSLGAAQAMLEDRERQLDRLCLTRARTSPITTTTVPMEPPSP